MSIDIALRQRGVTLVELIVFIVIVSVGVVGLISVISPMVRTSADPMVTKQLAAIAESLLNEAIHQPYTWCDPDDTAATTAQSYADCANPQNTLKEVPAGGEVRGGTPPGTGLDNVADYGSVVGVNNIGDAAGNNAMAGYKADIVVAHAGKALLGAAADDTAALSVTVTVTRNGETFSLTGYRFRYAPRI
ncbi:prepilin-type N-terminal cleavage/methylation domain-containing protein [Dechloromonas sp. A34]|uniref:prepilin-type N-terminal cleavage/methylation domain-containing protein n=1 Tax=Dechloromonas sp. A34 TaxID=447588 RepID=UPI00224877E7|nr:prepilin-type N-terminal cleavage/methylation domain-containing protein [Dechloromonas sp. A34]